MKRLLLINGVPASGKSSVARQVASLGPWPLLGLDTIKEALFAQLGTGDRDYNRQLGRASYQAMFNLAADFPEAVTIVMDAWFGFQPVEVLHSHMQTVGECSVLQVWCHAPPEIIGERYAARVSGRSEGHLGLEYVPELIELAHRAKPLENIATLSVDTTRPFEAAQFMAWLATQPA